MIIARDVGHIGGPGDSWEDDDHCSMDTEEVQESGRYALQHGDPAASPAPLKSDEVTLQRER